MPCNLWDLPYGLRKLRGLGVVENKACILYFLFFLVRYWGGGGGGCVCGRENQKSENHLRFSVLSTSPLIASVILACDDSALPRSAG